MHVVELIRRDPVKARNAVVVRSPSAIAAAARNFALAVR
jgi:hypothetical protein